MKLGINTYTFMWSIGFNGAWPEKPMTAMDLLQQAHDLGIKVVQGGPNLPLLELSQAELDRYVKQAHDWGIELELGTRGIDTAHLTEQIKLAKRIGAKLLRTIPEAGGQTPDFHDIPDYLRAVLPILEGEGVSVGLENGKIPAEDLKCALDEINSPRVGVILDTVNSMAVPEGWKYVAKILAPYAMCLHLKEFFIQRVWYMMGFVLEGRPTGKGQLDVPWLLDTVKAASRYDFNVIVEVWPLQQKTLQEAINLEHVWAAESVAYMRQFISE